MVTISQSGETLDTMEALQARQGAGPRAHALDLQRARERDPARLASCVFYTRAGAEIGVASTKAFTTQLAALFTLTLALAKLRGRLPPSRRSAARSSSCATCPGSVQHALNLEPQVQRLGRAVRRARQHALFLGRGIHYPIALEGALKLKEISYIHAEAYPAGELKHGPLALVDASMPVVVIAPNDALLEKVKSNMQEVRARGGELYVFADLDSHFTESEGVHVIRTPRHAGVLSPIVHAIPVQLLAYHTALDARHRRRQAAQPREVGHGRVEGKSDDEVAHLGGSQRAPLRVLQDDAHLFECDAWEPLNELGHPGTVFDVLEQCRHWHSRPSEHPRSADPIRVPLDDGAG